MARTPAAPFNDILQIYPNKLHQYRVTIPPNKLKQQPTNPDLNRDNHIRTVNDFRSMSAYEVVIPNGNSRDRQDYGRATTHEQPTTSYYNHLADRGPSTNTTSTGPTFGYPKYPQNKYTVDDVNLYKINNQDLHESLRPPKSSRYQKKLNDASVFPQKISDIAPTYRPRATHNPDKCPRLELSSFDYDSDTNKTLDPHGDRVFPEGYTPQKSMSMLGRLKAFVLGEPENPHDMEAFTNPETIGEKDELYRHSLKASAVQLCYYLLENPAYSHWIENWKILDKNLKKSNVTIDRLDQSADNVAYTKNKGEVIKMRWRDTGSAPGSEDHRYVSRSVLMYVFIHELCHQVFPPSIIGHPPEFWKMLKIMCAAGFELKMFDLQNIPEAMVYSNGQEITNRRSLQEEIIDGFNELIRHNPKSEKHYIELIKFVKSF